MSDRKIYVIHEDNKRSSGGGIGIGAVIAIILSYMKWHSIGWAIIHGMLGWIYVIYYFFTYGF